MSDVKKSNGGKMTKQEFNDYKWTAKTQVKMDGQWFDVSVVWFDKPKVDIKHSGQDFSVLLLAEAIEDIREKPEVRLPWTPEEHQFYYFVDIYGCVDNAFSLNAAYDIQRIKTGNCFKTPEEAEKHARRMVAMRPKFLPEEGEMYFYVGSLGVFDETFCHKDFSDLMLFWSGNTFETEQDATDWLDEYRDAFEVER